MISEYDEGKTKYTDYSETTKILNGLKTSLEVYNKYIIKVINAIDYLNNISTKYFTKK